MNIQQREDVAVAGHQLHRAARAPQYARELRHRRHGPQQGGRRPDLQPPRRRRRELPVLPEPQRQRHAGEDVLADSVVGTSGSDAFGRGALRLPRHRLETRAAYTFVGTRFNDEIGFIPRTNIGRTDGYFGLHFRPKRVSSWLRETFPHYQMVNITRADSGAFDSRYMDWHLPFTLQDSSFIELGGIPTSKC